MAWDSKQALLHKGWLQGGLFGGLPAGSTCSEESTSNSECYCQQQGVCRLCQHSDESRLWHMEAYA